MDKQTLRTILYVALGGVAAYVLYKAVTAVADKVSATTNTLVSKPIADAYVAATSGGPVTVRGAAILPNGAAVPMSNVNVADDFTFVFSGVKYRLTGSRDDGNYTAVAA